MKVLKWSDVMHILELHFEASQVADVALDLFDYAFEVENSVEGCKDCVYSWWSGESYECMRPVCMFESNEVENFLEEINESVN